MKTRIFMYLFIFSLLLIIFQYVNSKHIFEINENKMETYKEKVVKYKDSLELLNEKIFDLSNFSIENSEGAFTYFENQGYNIDELIPFIKDELYNLNQVNGEEHLLIPYAAGEGRKMLINTVRLINHKWIVTDFSDGYFWGELFLTYEIIDGKELKFKLEESLLYPLR